MKLHYSQTWYDGHFEASFVSVPYEITLLSNLLDKVILFLLVSVPYEITLLSNALRYVKGKRCVSVPYEITLLSNYSK